MALNYVTLTLDLYDGQGNPVIAGEALFTPSAVLTDAGVEIIGQQPIPCVFHASGLPTVKLLATDNSAPRPTGWTWGVTFTGITGAPAGFSFFLAFSNGSTQLLSNLIPVSSGTAFQAYMPLPTGTATSGYVPIATGSGEASAWGPLLSNAPVTLTQSGGTVAVSAAAGNVFNLTLTASGWTISNPSNPADGQVIRLALTQDSTGGRTVAWGTAYYFQTGSPPVLRTAPSVTDIIAFQYSSAQSQWEFLGSTTGNFLINSAASAIQPLGTQAAGATGLAADAGHVHQDAAALLAGLITRDQVSNLFTSTGTNSVTITFNVNPQAGSTVLLYVANTNGVPGSFVDNGTSPTTFTLDVSNTAGTNNIFIYRANNITLPASGGYTISSSSANNCFAAGAISYIGVAAGPPYASNHSTATSTTASSSTATVAGLIFGTFSDSNSASHTVTLANASFTEQFTTTSGSSSPGASGAADFLDYAAPVSQSCTWTLGASSQWEGGIAGYLPALPALGTVAPYGGTNTSSTAVASSPSFSTGVAKQLNLTQDVMLYLAVQTSAALAVAIGPTSGVADAIMPSQSYALSMISLRIPAGWWVKITGTIADLTITQVTC